MAGMFSNSRSKLACLLLLASATLVSQQRSLAADPSQPATNAPPSKAGAPGKDAKWDVSNPPGLAEARRAAIDVTEGTWLSLDVSPDGQTIVFDLLGDIYSIPITGGEAKAVTSGFAWDMQPRFSPDGQWIAFTSDRGGGDNIWIISAKAIASQTGKDSGLRQITKESFRLLNSPAWTPDGKYIAARKHFSSRRSLGAGEIWLYPTLGVDAGSSDGVQMTVKPTDQKDVGEPAFSPDGRYLYYSWDATPGSSFEYNKDSTGEVFVISRLDRIKGETERWITGAGGAVRPTPSPDGAHLAFVRRDQGVTCLFVQDVSSGEVRKLFSGLERDMQEAWSIHGVYPSMAWTPDSKSIVFYAKGGIHRLNVAARTTTQVPFRVRAEHRTLTALRTPVEVAPAEFDVRMLRGTVVSHQGNAVVYSALGHLYLRTLPEGKPRRLTQDDKRFEFMPAWSRDGKSIVYVGWQDEELGSVRIVSAEGGESRAVTTRPGHYVDPVFSPDGKIVVFGRVSGGHLLAGIHSTETGIYRASTTGGEMTRITRKGVRPHFGSANDRLFLITSEPDKENDNTKLFSIDLNGTEERTHLSSANATDFLLSPDGTWTAWVERFNVYMTPLLLVGKPIDVGPKSVNVPVYKVSSEAGVNLSWSGDSKALHWSLGPELFTQPVAEATSRLEKKAEDKRLEQFNAKDATAEKEKPAAKEAEPKPVGINISFKGRTDVPEGVVALKGGRIITMRGDEIVDRGVVLIRGHRVVEVGGIDQVRIPDGAFVLDCTGKTVLPGFIDVHAHGSQGQNGITPQQNWGRHADLAFGVTTIHDPSNDTESIFAASE
ncbi:MAG: amidohydrolase, partial [Verrucomicrobia bacterium]|nr:amidohydrolase [Verrucomicrobiota bacterium]